MASDEAISCPVDEPDPEPEPDPPDLTRIREGTSPWVGIASKTQTYKKSYQSWRGIPETRIGTFFPK